MIIILLDEEEGVENNERLEQGEQVSSPFDNKNNINSKKLEVMLSNMKITINNLEQRWLLFW